MCWGCKRWWVWWGGKETQKRTNDFCPDLSAVVQASCALRATASAKQSRAKAKRRRDDEGGRDIRTQPGGSTQVSIKKVAPSQGVSRSAFVLVLEFGPSGVFEDEDDDEDENEASSGREPATTPGRA